MSSLVPRLAHRDLLLMLGCLAQLECRGREVLGLTAAGYAMLWGCPGEACPFLREYRREIDWRGGGGGRGWEERREGRLWSGCKLNKILKKYLHL